jgi:hypothetical protein
MIEVGVWWFYFGNVSINCENEQVTRKMAIPKLLT